MCLLTVSDILDRKKFTSSRVLKIIVSYIDFHYSREVFLNTHLNMKRMILKYPVEEIGGIIAKRAKYYNDNKNINPPFKPLWEKQKKIPLSLVCNAL